MLTSKRSFSSRYSNPFCRLSRRTWKRSSSSVRRVENTLRTSVILGGIALCIGSSDNALQQDFHGTVVN